MCFYNFRTRRSPFESETLDGLFDRISRADRDPAPSYLSPTETKLLDGLLEKDPDARLTVGDLLEDPYLSAYALHEERQTQFRNRTPREKLEKKKQEKRVEFLKVFRSLAAERAGRTGDSEGGRTCTMQDWAARVRVYVCKQCNGSGFASLPQPLAVQEGGICIRAVEGGEASALARDKAKKGSECVGLSVLSAGEGGQESEPAAQQRHGEQGYEGRRHAE